MGDLYLRYEYLLAAAQLGLAMLGMGAILHVREFVDVLRMPRSFLIGLGVQTIGAPLVAVAIATLLHPPVGLALGLVLIAAVPGGTMSNVFTYFARGNVPLSIALTTVTTLGSLVVTPLLLRLLMSAHLPPHFAMPTGQVAFDIVVCLLGPLALGMVVGSTFPRIRDGFSRWCIRGSLLVIGGIVVGSADAGRIDPVAFGWEGPLLIAVFAITIQQIAVLGLLVLRAPRRDLVAIGLEVTIRNTNLGLLIKASLFPAVAGVADPAADGVLFVVLLYGAIALPASVPLFAAGRLAARLPGSPADAGRRTLPGPMA